MARYFPEPVPYTDDLAYLREYLGREFNRLLAAFEEVELLQVEELSAEPERPREGMIRFADGTNWNPGDGRGVYFYTGTVWNRLDLGSGAGSATFLSGIDFGSGVAASPQDTSRHIALWGTNNYGFSITGSQLNYVANATASHVWYDHNGVEHMRLNLNTNVLDITGVGQIKFPATQLASTNANTLDDYEEGIWTPDFTFVTPGDLSIVYSTQAGRYIKKGKEVTVWYHLVTTTFTHSTASGDARITGLPFTRVSATGEHTGDIELTQFTMPTGRTWCNGQVQSNVSFIRLIASGSAVGRAALNATNTTSGTNIAIIGSVTYEATS